MHFLSNRPQARFRQLCAAIARDDRQHVQQRSGDGSIKFLQVLQVFLQVFWTFLTREAIMPEPMVPTYVQQ